jgi:hypothetical protein
MADNDTTTKDGARPPREPMGPGLLIILGLGLVAVSAWCGGDYFNPPVAWKDRPNTVYFNGGAMLLAAAAALGAFVLAFLRYRKSKSKPEADPKPPVS